MTATRSTLIRVALLALAGAALLPATAQAYWRGGGFFFGFPGVYVAPLPPPYYYPPAYYPPPAYLAPPATYAAPQSYAEPQSYGAQSGGPPPAAQACYAAGWVCPLERPTPVGDSCACPANGGQAWGHAN